MKNWRLDYRGNGVSSLSIIPVDIGFQGEDPATDFRGAGILGLKNLHFYVNSHNEESMKIYLNSVQKESEYFFASGGIYISLKISEWVKEGIFDRIFEDCVDNRSSLSMVDTIYFNIFKEFDYYWMQLKEKNIMVFNEEIVLISD